MRPDTLRQAFASGILVVSLTPCSLGYRHDGQQLVDVDNKLVSLRHLATENETLFNLSSLVRAYSVLLNRSPLSGIDWMNVTVQ